MIDSKSIVHNLICTALRGEKVDWPDAGELDSYATLLAQATRHGVDALLCHQLNLTADWAQVPGYVKDALSVCIKNSVAIEMARSKDLASLCASLEQEHIPTLILKGAALAHTHYPEAYLRSRCDTDIYIAPQTIRRFRDLSVGLGYQLSGFIYKSHQFNCFKTTFGGGAVNYDVHWRPANWPKYARVLGYEELWSSAVSIPKLAGAFTLSPVHSLLLACMHRAGSARHDPDRLIWLYDIHLLMSGLSQRESIEFARRAVRGNIQRECRDAIEKAHECFATSIPEEVLNTLAASGDLDSAGRRFSNSSLGLIVDDLKQLPDIPSRVELMREYLFPSGDYLLARYGRKGLIWVPLLYLKYVLVGLFERVSLR